MPAWLTRLRQAVKDKRAETGMKLDGYAQAQGYHSWGEKRQEKRLKKAGYAYCPNCSMNVRPQSRWGFVKIVSLTLLEPGKLECPRCKGTMFLPPAVASG